MMSPDKKRIYKLSLVFFLVYFFSSNGIASLPAITIQFLLKNVLHMTATQAAYFGAISVIGWSIKPIWGLISDAFPIFGYRRKSYLVITSGLSALVWVALGQMSEFAVGPLLGMFVMSSLLYSFMDVIADGLMVQTGKPLGLTGKFQSVQWTAVYVAAIIAGYAGGWVATNLSPQNVFSINAIFPLIILLVSLFFVQEDKVDATYNKKAAWGNVKNMLKSGQIWLLGFFLFFITFSPSFGTPFFYYAVDKLAFDQIFFGWIGTVGSIAAALGAITFGFLSHKIRTRTFIQAMIILGVVFTLLYLVYFTPYMLAHITLVKVSFLIFTAIAGLIGSLTFLVMLNAAALSAPQYSEGTTFALLTAFWNLGTMGSGLAGGFLFERTGLPWLIVISALFTAAAWLFLNKIKFGDEILPAILEPENPVEGIV